MTTHEVIWRIEDDWGNGPYQTACSFAAGLPDGGFGEESHKKQPVPGLDGLPGGWWNTLRPLPKGWKGAGVARAGFRSQAQMLAWWELEHLSKMDTVCDKLFVTTWLVPAECCLLLGGHQVLFRRDRSVENSRIPLRVFLAGSRTTAEAVGGAQAAPAEPGPALPADAPSWPEIGGPGTLRAADECSREGCLGADAGLALL